MERPTGVFFSEKITSLDISDMSFIMFDVFSQYLVKIWSKFININQIKSLHRFCQKWNGLTSVIFIVGASG